MLCSQTVNLHLLALNETPGSCTCTIKIISQFYIGKFNVNSFTQKLAPTMIFLVKPHTISTQKPLRTGTSLATEPGRY